MHVIVGARESGDNANACALLICKHCTAVLEFGGQDTDLANEATKTDNAEDPTIYQS
jgi:hypothetical protein